MTADKITAIKKALEAAEQFIVNGVELGYIRMPDPQTQDSAHDTLPMIRQAQTALESLQRENEALGAQALRDRKLRDEAQDDAIMWRFSVAMGDHQPLLVKVWEQRCEAFKRAEAVDSEVKRLRDSLSWAMPLAEQYLAYTMGERAKAGHTSLGTVVGTLYDSEVADRDRARTALASTGGERHAE